MLNVLIVDDEKWMRKTLRNAVEWNQLGMNLVFEAEDGAQAYEAIIRLKPELVLADIQMPGMDGITLLRRVKDEGIMSMFIFLSGYDRFDYAQNAINLGAIGYLLKPVDEHELKEMLIKAKELHLDKQVEQHKKMEGLVSRLLQGEAKSEHYQEFLQLQPKAVLNKFVVVAVELDDMNTINWNKMNQNQTIITAWKTQTVKCGFTCEFVFSKAGISVLIMPNKQLQEMESAVIEAMCRKAAAEIRNLTGYTISCGIGQMVSSFSLINSSYLESGKALEYKLLLGKESIVAYERLRIKTFGVELLDHALKVTIANFIKQGDPNHIDSIIQSVKSRMEECQPTPQDLKLFIYSFIDLISHSLLAKTALESQMDPNKLYEDICNCVGLEAVFLRLKSLLEKVSSVAFLDQGDFYKKLVEGIKVYIHSQYKQDISLESISREFHFSPNYISKIFKEATGESILDYALNFRMQVAKELLLSLHNSISDVAGMVGYKDNPKYFTKVFKKSVGITPMEYLHKRKL
ncbi:response regulator [Paenibacillus psychroresistens]|uniref:Response regulator n=1 Tax=Paenibacillus psychroresistens TaxID=1778678 RepID=A0A6B8RQ48_9BACL|nr:response regulator [Paenibacillus psychroresistens]QGQ97665.1 response regulator [Paenibacillus psychroresistens]